MPASISNDTATFLPVSFAFASAGKSEAAAEFTSLVAKLCGQVADAASTEGVVEQDGKPNPHKSNQQSNQTIAAGTVVAEQPILTTTFWLLPTAEVKVAVGEGPHDGAIVELPSADATEIEDAEDSIESFETSPAEGAVPEILIGPILPNIVLADTQNAQQASTGDVSEQEHSTTNPASLPLPMKGLSQANPPPESSIPAAKPLPTAPNPANPPVTMDSHNEAEAERFSAFDIQLRTSSASRTTPESEKREPPAVRPPVAGKEPDNGISAAESEAPQTGQDGQQQSTREQSRTSNAAPGKEAVKPSEPSIASTSGSVKTANDDLKLEPHGIPHTQVRPQHDESTSGTAIGVVSNDRPTTSTAAMDTIQRIEALRLGGVTMPRQQTLHDLEIRIPSLGAPVDIKLSDRGGNVEISVRSADPLLAQQLHAQLPELIETLETRGYEASALIHHENRPEIVTAQLSRSAYENSENESSRRQEQQQQQNSRQRGRNRRNDGQTQFRIEENQISTSIL